MRRSGVHQESLQRSNYFTYVGTIILKILLLPFTPIRRSFTLHFLHLNLTNSHSQKDHVLVHHLPVIVLPKGVTF
ncbi:hypothetical protein PHAVU_007G036900 [Phaseolus vulgaris]|uniref:Uncharacterized protein n=1 Tax=Phaseolus vulgaris TaxID=3885 RepID=V7BB12_PHAVU|nr:hypothetical protein PHAVU_007G036900g [Phaseolus vulgaris]ESW15014.1 hypothetical protein PHAVU_007G036900g [Phaseolus vulgaris]